MLNDYLEDTLAESTYSNFQIFNLECRTRSPPATLLKHLGFFSKKKRKEKKGNLLAVLKCPTETTSSVKQYLTASFLFLSVDRQWHGTATIAVATALGTIRGKLHMTLPALEQSCLSFLWRMLSLQVWDAPGYHQPSATPRLQITRRFHGAPLFGGHSCHQREHPFSILKLQR